MTATRLRIERLTGSAADAEAVVGPLLNEYVRWCVDRLVEEGHDIGDPAEAVERHHAVFRAELPTLLGPRGRLLVAVRQSSGNGDGAVAGVGALKPVDAGTAEVKRMYVRPSARGQRAGRALLRRLLTDAAALGHREVRLETARFMTEARELYRSLGFTETGPFAGNEAAVSGFEEHVVFLRLRLPDERVLSSIE
ncbi:GNAT family N-acetyltransferase [Jiangella anatolica]|uniref:GNAT family N-acetyltransferase n=1 Tax=Jiangella anatolica TaxID=2670374 RepID=UPI0018F7704E|nr:GNAT family N-acetyltransferase [Jiangella anatolica]